MSFLDCSCISHTQVQPMDIEECYEDTGQHRSGSGSTPPHPTVGCGDGNVAPLSAEPAHYQFLLELGWGFNNLSQVRMARHTPTGQLVAIKQTNLDECTEEELLQLLNEVFLSRRVRHPNLLTFRLVFSSCCQLWVLTPLMAYGSAHFLMRTYFPDGMSESLIAYLLYGVLQALDYLHCMGYVHRGVKASHILLSEEGRVYLSGLHGVYSMMREGKRMRAVFDMPHHSPALLPWLSPELLQQTLLLKLRGLHRCLTDTAFFPLGELGALKVSRSGVDSGMGESATHSTGAPPPATEGPRSPGPKNQSATLHNLVQLCLQQQPERRPTASALMSHAFFKQVKRHTRDSFLSLVYPAVPLSSSEVALLSSYPPSPNCHSPTAVTAGCVEPSWDFS
ncbi:STE20-related kinase adapter protein beta isoform X2 [Hippocampus zosterae]|uniref:STE20-related kinase adapter protein beta isoform X2 n=1 Tax=Hippocampus zosterae TaxID=109293 RepID=UPI00223E7A8A|nr:STE20-related kinase adapter protein beta isoform X2 [Hippocampus zosterae]